MARSLLAALPKVQPSFPIGEAEGAGVRAQPMVQPQAGQPIPSVAMLVTLAAADPAVERRRKQAAQAERGLDALEALQRELLTGTATPERLREIVEWAATLETPDDPVLAQIARDIDLRVRVELAKYDVQV